MKYRIFGKTGEKVSVLGYGNMRLPVSHGDHAKIDVEAALKLVRHAIDNLDVIAISDYNYELMLRNSGMEAEKCNNCGQCAFTCPQGIDIPVN